MLTPHCDRWRDGRRSYRPAGEPIDTSRYEVRLIPEADAKRFVIRTHYSKSYPAARARGGLFRFNPFGRDELVGVVVYSVPMQGRAIPRWTGLEPNAGVEIGRLVLLDDVPANGESWFVARANRLMLDALPDVRGLLTYADPAQGHVGTIYQALNYRFVGRSSPRTHIVGVDGKVVSGRMLSKIRLDEQGATYSYDKLRALGAPARRLMEEGAAYVKRALAEGPFSRRRHPGNLAYVWAANKRDRRQLPPALPYLKLQEMTA